MDKTVTITVDGETIETLEGSNVLEAALRAGICIPNLCYLPDGKPTGACRVCLVEVESHGRKKMTASCTLEARDAMVIHAHSDNVLRARRNIIELILAESPESEVLQKLAERVEVGEVRYPLRDKDCILCGRCVSACAYVARTANKGLIGRGTQRHIGLPFYKQEYCQRCRECDERCPLGIQPSARRGEACGVCGSELSKNDDIPDICQDCVLD